jgi:hypothetical protein
MLPSKPGERPRPALLWTAGAVLLFVAVYALWPAASKPVPPSNPPRVQQKPAAKPGPARDGKAASHPGTTSVDQLDVRLEDLKQPRPQPDDAGRNPFRFYLKPPPPPPPPPRSLTPSPANQAPAPPPGPPPLPPIPLKFIGTMEQGSRKVAIFSDGRGLPLYGKEGELILGQYKIVRIGVESVVMEYSDGRGRQTIPMRGQ